MRVMAPDGTLGEVPAENVQAAIAAGGRVMTPSDLRNMYHQIFMEHSLFQEKQRKVERQFQPRHMRHRRHRAW